MPARPRKPRDKAKAEADVLQAERWVIPYRSVFAVLNDHMSAVVDEQPLWDSTHSSNAIFNQALQALLAVLNSARNVCTSSG